MERDEILAALGRTPHYGKLGEALQGALAGHCRPVELEAGELLFREGQACGGFYVVVDGRLRVFRSGPDGREQVLHELGPGYSCAEAALLELGVYPASALALEPTRLLRVDGPGFLELFREDEHLAAAMVSSLSSWLLRLVGRVEELSVASAGARLAHYLTRLPAESEAGQRVVVLPMSKKDLAGYLSITPETLSRLLRRWVERELITMDRRRLTVLDEAVLVAVADSELRP